ncbi:MAG: GAF domain-containing protein [Proteobacteria bacterium]|nr:GAF domain-containing protein [Pseudomonadota bacterium]MBU1650328.1 GAF domain-containing protein [Pseudomonadota bacterium]
MTSLLNIVKGLWPTKIRYQLICGVALVHLLLMTFFVFDLVSRQRDFLRQQSLEQTTNLAEALALNSSSWVLANDVIGLQEIVRAVGQYPGLRYAMIISTNGKVLAHTDESHIGQYLADDKSRTLHGAESKIKVIHADQELLDVAAPILAGTGKNIGWARIAQGQEKITDNLVIISRNGILYTLLAIVMGSLFALLLGNRLTSGLNKLLLISQQIKHGRRDQRMKISHHDEIALLGEGFNSMLDALVANEDLILLNQQRLESLADIFQFQAANQQELLDYALEQAIHLTDSKFGYIYYYDEDKREFTLNSWSKEALKECSIIEPPTRYQLDTCGLWGETVRQRRPILVNNFQAENPLKKGYPQGHVALSKFLTIPIFLEKQIVAVLGVANKTEDYNQTDITQLTLLMDGVWKLVERMRTEEALRASESRIQSISNNFTAGMIYQVVIRPDGTRTFTYVSDSVKQLYGVSPEEVMADATLIYSRVDENYIKSLTEAEKEAGRTFSTFTAEVPIKDPSGQTRWSSLVSTPTRMTDGSICWNGIELIITDRKEAEQKLAQAAREWSAAMDASDDVIYLLNLERHIIRANKAFYLATGTTQEATIGHHIVEFIHPQGEPIPCPVCRAQEEQRDLQIVMEADNPDNPMSRPLDITVKIVRDQEQRPMSILMTLHDLSTARKEMEEKVNLERQLQQAQKMESVGRLAGGVAHDFNNMLGVIIGHTELAMELVDPAQPLHASLAEILKAAQRSADLTRQLLTFARKQTVLPKVLDLNKTVEGMLTMLCRLIGEDIALNWQPATNLWPVKVDPSQIDQILANLCVNARDAIEGVGKLSIETGNCTIDEDYCTNHLGTSPGEYVLLSVSDSGCGMDKETLAHIFEPFFTTKGVGEGTGLGLATVDGVVHQNNGFINAYSEPGQGTTFTIYLPRHVGQAEQTLPKITADAALGGQETILLVEDEPAILKMTTMMFEGLGYTVLAANRPADAIRLAREHTGKICLLMTDVVMPEMNGRDLAEKLLALYPELKILFMSGYTADIIAHNGILDEKANFIQKPFLTNDLALKVREVLESE